MEDRPSLRRVFLVFLGIGSTAYGGVWANARRIETRVVERFRWIDADELRSLLVVSTVTPAPKFLAMGALVGHRARGLPGAFVAILGLLAPSATAILAAAVLLPSDLLSGDLAPLSESVGVAVVGLLAGNALYQWRSGDRGGPNRTIGTLFAAAMLALTVVGVPLVPIAVGGFLLAPLVIRDRTTGG